MSGQDPGKVLTFLIMAIHYPNLNHMLKPQQLLLLSMLLISFSGWTQCLTPPPPPPCSGTDPQVSPNETLNQGTTRYFSGSATSMNSLTLNGGTLVVCGDLTIDQFFMDSGTIYVHPGARFVIGSGLGAGLILRGNSAIYNYGTCEIQRNLSLDNGWASAEKPNIVVNATPDAVFRMSNQYLVINNPNSWFVNNGDAEFWGTIQDNMASPGSICLGDGSETNMAVLINKVDNTYTVPTGSACVRVRQYSQFYGQLTAESGLRACLGASHSSDSGCTPFGCTPNDWGAATLLSNCGSCASFAVLATRIHSFQAQRTNLANQLSWQMENAQTGAMLRVLRSGDGRQFQAFDSLQIVSTETTHFQTTDKSPLTGENFYMVQYLHRNNNYAVNSNTIKINTPQQESVKVYPVPFDDNFTIQHDSRQIPRQVMLTDMTGRNLRICWYRLPQLNQVKVVLLEPLASDIYLLHMRTDASVISRTIWKH
jgi:hypothetical protein